MGTPRKSSARLGRCYMLTASHSLSGFDEARADSTRHKGHRSAGRFILWVGLANTIDPLERFQACIARTS
ncbi:hypothetical protein A9K66_00190 [Mesorhizobium sp. AA23]|nr:hypothetical protein A9K66_00190 [Mesorhizobium sp. AA23]